MGVQGVEPGREEGKVYEVKGCRYTPRCSGAVDKCFKLRPPMVEVEKNHWVACWLYAKA